MTTTTLGQRQTTTVMTEPVFKWWDYSIFAVLTVAMFVMVPKSWTGQ
jgi:hypothetical protein